MLLDAGYEDELAWAAAWLYKATSNASYLADARKYYSKVGAQQLGTYELPDRASIGDPAPTCSRRDCPQPDILGDRCVTIVLCCAAACPAWVLV